jgi:tRNA(fMet)-specific endonuclease VapC
MYVVDTNTVIYFFKGMGRVAERLLAQPPGQLGVPALVVYELEVGVAKSSAPERRGAQLADFLDAAVLLPFEREDARVAAHIRADLERRGEPIGPLDVLIAGTALRRGATLVTRNTSEFRRVGGLTIENWYD